MAFRVAGWLSRPHVGRWRSSGGRRVLVIAPHPDDEVAGCAGTLMLHRKCGDEVSVAYVTDGRRSGALGLVPVEMARRRHEEAAAVAQVLGVNQVWWLGLPEGEWEEGALRAGLNRILGHYSPHLIYAPSCLDFHPEHRRVASVLAKALADQNGRSLPLVRVYQVHVPLTSALTNLVAPTASVAEASLGALLHYASQLGSLYRTVRMKRYAACFFGEAQSAEEFWELRARAYCLLHRDSTTRTPAVLQGVRAFALTDPLAYLSGLDERRRIAALVRASSHKRQAQESGPRTM